jgi:hypothetical protein
MTVIIGVDPGESMGVAALMNGVLIGATQGTAQEGLIAVELLLDRFRNVEPTYGSRKIEPDTDVIVAMERFVSQTRQVHSHQPVAQQMVGAVTLLAEQYGARVVMQGPADARFCANNHLLRKLGMFQTRGTVDQQDANDANMAIRHALLCLSRVQASVFETLVEDEDEK